MRGGAAAAAAAALVLAGSAALCAAESASSHRIILEIDDRLPTCGSNWDTEILAEGYTHLVARGVELVGATCTFGAAPQQCLTPARLDMLRTAGIVPVADVTADAATLTACLARQDVEARTLAQSLLAAAGVAAGAGAARYSGVLLNGALALNADLPKAVQEALPANVLLAVSFPSAAADDPATLEQLRATAQLAGFTVLQYPAPQDTVLPTADLTSKAQLLGVLSSRLLLAWCYGTPFGCLSSAAVASFVESCVGEPDWEKACTRPCPGGVVLQGDANAFAYELPADRTLFRRQRALCRAYEAASARLGSGGPLRIQHFTPLPAPASGGPEGKRLLPSSVRLDASSYLMEATALSLNYDGVPLYPHKTASVPDLFDPQAPGSAAGFVEEWGCLGGACSAAGVDPGVLGWDDAFPDFLKIGVGRLSRPAGSPAGTAYDPSGLGYKLESPLAWTITWDASSPTIITLEASDSLGRPNNVLFGYKLVRTIEVVGSRLVVTRSLRNTGNTPIRTAHVSFSVLNADNLTLLEPPLDEVARVHRLALRRWADGAEPENAFVGGCKQSDAFCGSVTPGVFELRGAPAREYLGVTALPPRGVASSELKPPVCQTSPLCAGEPPKSKQTGDFTYLFASFSDRGYLNVTRQHGTAAGVEFVRIALGAVEQRFVSVQVEHTVTVNPTETVSWTDNIDIQMMFQASPDTSADGPAVVVAVALTVIGLALIVWISKSGVTDNHDADPPALPKEDEAHADREDAPMVAVQ